MSHEHLKVNIAISVDDRAMAYFELDRADDGKLEVNANIDNRDPHWAQALIIADAGLSQAVQQVKERAQETQL